MGETIIAEIKILSIEFCGSLMANIFCPRNLKKRHNQYLQVKIKRPVMQIILIKFHLFSKLVFAFP